MQLKYCVANQISGFLNLCFTVFENVILLQERGQDGIPGTHPQGEFMGCRLCF